MAAIMLTKASYSGPSCPKQEAATRIPILGGLHRPAGYGGCALGLMASRLGGCRIRSGSRISDFRIVFVFAGRSPALRKPSNFEHTPAGETARIQT